MHAIEFIAKEENGTIALPKQYVGALGKNIRVILLIDDEPILKPQKIALPRAVQKVRTVNFKAAKIKTKNLKFAKK